MRKQDGNGFLFVLLIGILFGFVLGAAELLTADSWVNSTGYIIPNSSWSQNVNITGNFSVEGSATVRGALICLADGTNCPSLSSGNGWVNTTNNVTLVDTADNVSAGRLVVDNTNGRVGVGTSTPGVEFVVVGSNARVQARSTSTSTGIRGRFSFRTTNSDGGENAAMEINRTNAPQNNDGQLQFWSSYNTVQTDWLWLGYLGNSSFRTGNLGIGTIFPTHRLSVVGDQNLTGNLYIHGNITSWSPLILQTDGITRVVVNDTDGSVQVGYGVKLWNSTLQPSCDVSKRGMMWYVPAILGVADTLQVCRKTVLDTYAWGVMSIS